jgi:hypothetical protein
MVDF